MPRSVWDFPRPPAVEQWGEHVVLTLGGVEVASTTQAWCVLETSHPPTYYLPRAAFAPGALVEAGGSSFCEWKGRAAYVDVVGGDLVAPRAGWYYPTPDPAYAMLAEHVAVYAGAMDSCTVDGDLVQPQEGGFYGGWITSKVTGPFKGPPGTLGW